MRRTISITGRMAAGAAFALLAAACSPIARGPNRQPVANAGPDQQVRAGALVVLDGNASFDPEGDPLLEFEWTISVAPAGAQASLQGADSILAALQPDRTGVWLVRLSVSDGDLWSLPDVAEIRVRAAGCQNDIDCDDSIACTADSCDQASHTCLNQPDDAQCPDDGEFCNGGEFCSDMSGCSHTGNPCSVAADCDENNDTCGACGDGTVNLAAGEECDYGSPQFDHCCRVADCHWISVGYPDAQAICAGAPDCKIDVCDGQGGCLQANASDGTSCTDNGTFCDGPERCFQGNCQSSGNPCPTPSDCDEDNDTCTGCGLEPASLAVECQRPMYLPLDPSSKCLITPAGGPIGVEACLSCSARAGPFTLAGTDFADDGDGSSCAELETGLVDGWSLVSGLMCYSVGTGCPMSGSDARNCCTNFTCPSDSGEVAFQADDDTCAYNPSQWRLQRAFDATGLQNLELCFDYADRGAGANDDVLQVEARDLRDGANHEVLFCDADGPRAGIDDTWLRQCVPLPAFADDNPALQVLFFLHSNNNNNRVYLDNITLRGESISCPAPREEVFVENFENCPSPLGDWNGWSVSDAPLICDTGFTCFDGSKRVMTNNTTGLTGELTRYLDLSHHSAVDLCFYYGENGADAGEAISVSLDTGSGWRRVLEHQGDFGVNSTCEKVCLDLSRLDPAVDQNPQVGLRFSLEANNKEIDLDQISVTAARYCTGMVPFTLSAIQDNGDGSYSLGVTDLDQQLAGDIDCHWAGGSPAGASPVMFRTADIIPSNVSADLLCANPRPLAITQPADIDTDAGTIGGVAPQDIVFFHFPQEPGVPELGVFVFDSISIAADVTVSGIRSLVLLSCHDVSISGKLDAGSHSRLAGPGGQPGGFSTMDGGGDGAGGGGSSSGWDDSGGGGAGHAGVGGVGGENGASGGTAGLAYGVAELVPLLGGSGGGGGSGGEGGGGGGAVQISARGIIEILSPGGISAGGAGGRAPMADGTAAGGGGSGGAILLEALDIRGNGTLAANGGGGGGGDDYGDAVVNSLPGQDGPFGRGRAAGGSSSGNGGDGGDGGGAFDIDGDDGESDTNAGGGGGAAGFIRLNTLSGSSSFQSTGVTSPAPATGACTEGQIGLR